jgi:molecular chaperone DnaK
LEAVGVLKSEAKAQIEPKAEALAKASQKLGEKMYADSQKAAEAAAAAAQPADGGEAGENKQAAGDVVDAEFTEVKDKKAG